MLCCKLLSGAIMPRQTTFQPFLGLTIGDPAGIGPEILAKAVTQEEVRVACRPLIIGEAGIMRRAIRLCHLDLHVRSIASPAEMTADPGCLEVLDLKNIDTASCPPGVLGVSPGGGSEVPEALLEPGVGAGLTGSPW